MDIHFLRNLKLAIAVSLVCLWAFASVEQIAFLGDTFVLPIIAVFLQYTEQQWNRVVVLKWRDGVLTLVVLAVIFGSGWLLSETVPQETLRSVWHNPAVVFVVWALWVCALVRQASQISRMAPNYSLKRTFAGWRWYPVIRLRPLGRLAQALAST